MNKFLFTITLFIFSVPAVFADAFVPDFNSMKMIRCEISETIYNSDNSVVTQNKYHKIFRLDDVYKKIYLNKAPVDRIISYDNDLIKIYLQTLTDDSIISETAEINKTSGTYSSTARITYDNVFFGVRYSKAQGVCTPIN